MTYTYATLAIPATAYRDVHTALGGTPGMSRIHPNSVIDMHGLAVKPRERPAPGAGIDLDTLNDFDPRPSVMMLARLIEQQLAAHDKEKGGQSNWRACALDDLMEHLFEEVDEVEEAMADRARHLRNGAHSRDSRELTLKAVGELADMAALAMMVIDTMLKLREADDAAH